MRIFLFVHTCSDNDKMESVKLVFVLAIPVPRFLVFTVFPKGLLRRF